MIPRDGLATVILIAAACSMLDASAASPRDLEKPIEIRPWGEESEGFRSRIWLDEAPKAADSPVVIHYEIQNVSKEDQTVWHSGFWPNHRIDVKGPDGKLAAMSAGGELVRKAFDPEGRREKNVPFNLTPGKSDDSWEAYDVRGIFPMADAGASTIQYVYQQGSMKPVESNVLKVVVPGP